MPEKLFEDAVVERDIRGRWYVLHELYPISPGFPSRKEAKTWLARINGEADE
jgi:hypothetical protein